MRMRPQIPQMGQGLGRMNRDRVSQGLSRLNADGTAKGPGMKQAGYMAPPAMSEPMPPMQNPYPRPSSEEMWQNNADFMASKGQPFGSGSYSTDPSGQITQNMDMSGAHNMMQSAPSQGGSWDTKLNALNLQQQAMGQAQSQGQPMPGGYSAPQGLAQQKAQYANQAMGMLGNQQQALGQAQSAMGRFQMPFRQAPRRY